MKEITLAILIGFIGHRLEGPIRSWFSDDDAAKLASYTTGGLLILIAFIAVIWDLLPPKERMIALVSLCAALLGIGSGVTLAHIADGISRSQ
jgi:hypothetical protein